MNLLLWIVLGAIAGWISSKIMKSDHSTFEDILLGIIGAFVGGYIMNLMGKAGITGFNLYSLLVAIGGSVLLIILGRVLRK